MEELKIRSKLLNPRLLVEEKDYSFGMSLCLHVCFSNHLDVEYHVVNSVRMEPQACVRSSAAEPCKGGNYEYHTSQVVV